MFEVVIELLGQNFMNCTITFFGTGNPFGSPNISAATVDYDHLPEYASWETHS